jgi:biopolymer transport protein ExbB
LDKMCGKPKARRWWRVNRSTLPLLGLVAAATLITLPAMAWWNDEWQLRKKITIDASATGANVTDPIGAAPVLVRLHMGNFRFSSAKEDGSDLRFIAGDDKTPLKHHVEKFDSLLGEALVWVGLPNLQPGAKTEIWLYYGDKKAVSTSDPKATYDPDTLLVYHFSERGAPPADSSVWAHNATSVGQTADGAIIGNGLRLDGRTALTLPAPPTLVTTNGAPFTWSAWIKPAALQPNATLFSRRDGANGFLVGVDNGAPFIEVTNEGVSQRSPAGAPIAANAWRHLAVVANAGTVTVYLDGNAYASLTAPLPTLNTGASIGGEAANLAQPDAESSAPVATGFAGELDELQISKVARPAGFLKIAAIGQGPEQKNLISFSVDEETASWLSGYFAVILKSVTLDGWIVISILLIMAAISWVVMIERASYLNRQSKANAQFMLSFREIATDLAALDHGDAANVATFGGRISASDAERMRASSLYRIYHIGASEIRHRFAANGGRPMALSGPSLAAIRAALDSGLVKEKQRLNRLMVVLTIAISGGPFLGLLGTVVGVMITFAAIAASGDVNVNAIAPGIAAALVATVAGLGVAIPALFGYNYLITRIKDLTSDIQVFVDEFVTKMAESYSPDSFESGERRAVGG